MSTNSSDFFSVQWLEFTNDSMDLLDQMDPIDAIDTMDSMDANQID